MKLYALRDKVADAILPNIMLFPHDAPAVRTFGDILSNQRSDIGQHPNDFDLVTLGKINLESGEIEPYIMHTVITGQAWLFAQKERDQDAPQVIKVEGK